MSGDSLRWDTRSAVPRWLRVASCAVPLLAVAGLVADVARHAPQGRVVGQVVWVLLTGTAAYLANRRQEVVVDATGIRMPLRRPVAWADVDHVEQPGPWDSVVRVVAHDGSARATGLPSRFAQDVARIGDKPLRR
ncbi:hypothetical protein RKE38_14810 [Phycicoccus sp. M110.8]|uniref:hypothetical protein n=1 Tax=Phycicoccus sp. M110.8 TaxID=3075433 RepID=UPI0028FD8BD2|nr:hypothetical protein [Phycicoccus sp. M110.8]MDU0314968.1 hypothetical protein [Phycicoccus sp. M110.8]